jgi:glutathione peroxidase-family protein
MGLEVLAIAVDDKTKNWRDAIKQDGTSVWHNIMDIAGAGNEVEINDAYDVHTYPSKILIDRNGVIVQRYIGSANSDALDKKLAEIFKAN